MKCIRLVFVKILNIAESINKFKKNLLLICDADFYDNNLNLKYNPNIKSNKPIFNTFKYPDGLYCSVCYNYYINYNVAMKKF